MNKIITIIAFTLVNCLFFKLAYNQVPQAIPYQAIARDASGNLLSNQAISLRFSIHDATASGTIVYKEIQNVTTNMLGLFTTNIGQGTPVTGTLAAVNWASGSKYLQTEMDATGGTSYTNMGTTQLMSVPYALSSSDNQWTKTGSNISNNNAGNVGIGTTTPNTPLTVNSSSPTNWIATNVGGNSGDRIVTGLLSSKATIGAHNDSLNAWADLNINPYGNVAIGEMTPLVKLDVNGTIRATKIGIGTATPQRELDVRGDIAQGSWTDNIPSRRIGVMDNSLHVAGMEIENTTLGGNYSQKLHLLTHHYGATTDRRLTIDEDGKVGIGTSNPSALLHVNGSFKLSNGTEGAGKVLTSDATGLATWATPAITLGGSGTEYYIPKWSGPNSLTNSSIQDDGSHVAINAAPLNDKALYVYNFELGQVDGQSGIHGFRTRPVINNGSGYDVSSVNSAINGYNFWGDICTFGISGHCWNDYTRTGGVLGAYYSGAYWGSLGYNSSANVAYGVYGSAAYASGTGLLPQQSLNGIGGGFFGTIGSVSKGSVIGQLNEGELFATYNKGDVYTAGKQIELITTNEKVIPVYAVSSAEVKVYNDGKIQLVNGSATVRFDENYQQLIGNIPTITVSPMGACNGVYVASVSKEGFVIKEQNNGQSNTTVSWISIGQRSDANDSQVPEMLTQPSFNRNLSLALHNDGNKKQSGLGMWWNGKSLQFGETPRERILTKEEKEKLMKENK